MESVSVVPCRPVETAAEFVKPRLRLCQQVPVTEVLWFVERYQNQEEHYPDLRRVLAAMVRDVQRVFAQDLFTLHAFEVRLVAGQYTVTRRGRLALRDRLRDAFSDGVAYRIRVHTLTAIDSPPVAELRPDIQLSSVMGQLTATLSRRIGDQVGIDVTLASDILGPRGPDR